MESQSLAEKRARLETVRDTTFFLRPQTHEALTFAMGVMDELIESEKDHTKE